VLTAPMASNSVPAWRRSPRSAGGSRKSRTFRAVRSL
jgi:hypothetical protein